MGVIASLENISNSTANHLKNMQSPETHVEGHIDFMKGKEKLSKSYGFTTSSLWSVIMIGNSRQSAIPPKEETKKGIYCPLTSWMAL